MAAVTEFLRRLWDAYFNFIAPLFPWLQWGVGIGASLVILSWGARKIAARMHDCPNCGRVIPKSWNPCQMCGHEFPQPDPPGAGASPQAGLESARHPSGPR